MEVRRVVVKVKVHRPRLSRRVVSAWLLALCLSVGLLPQAALADDPAEGSRFRFFVQARTAGGVVVSDSPQASKAGLDVLDQGGNAVDAAIATTFAIGVTRPEMCGIGGGGFLVYRGADGTTAALDFRETAPAAMDENTFNEASEGGGTNEATPGIHNVSIDANGDGKVDYAEESGHMVVGVPGVVAGMDEAFKKLGSGRLDSSDITFADLIEDAEAYAREGIRVSNRLQSFFALLAPKLANYPETARVYGGRFVHGPIVYNPLRTVREQVPLGEPAPAAPGDPTAPDEPAEPAAFKQEDYAKSLRLIMEHGRDAFYEMVEYEEGPSIAKLIVEDMRTAEDKGKTNPILLAKTDGVPNDIGLVTERDLASYEPVWRTPLVGHYRDHQIVAMPPPAGGMVVTEILNLLENFKLSSFGHSTTDHIHALAEAEKLAWADRIAYLSDPDFETVPTDVLTSKRYAQQRVGEISMETAKSVADYGHGTLTPPHEGTHTTHISVIDRDGNAVAVTCSLEGPFGSGVVAPGTGFLLNGQLSDFDWTWGNGAPAPANAPAGGKRPRSAMSPTIVVKDERPVLVTGGAGGPTIIGGVVQNIVNVVDFGLDIWHAIDAPRVDSVAGAFLSAADALLPTPCGSEKLSVEHPRIPQSIQTELQGRGHAICKMTTNGYALLPVIQSAGTDLVTGERVGASENREPDDSQGAMGQKE